MEGNIDNETQILEVKEWPFQVKFLVAKNQSNFLWIQHISTH